MPDDVASRIPRTQGMVAWLEACPGARCSKTTVVQAGWAAVVELACLGA